MKYLLCAMQSFIMKIRQYIKPPKSLSGGIYVVERDEIHSTNKQIYMVSSGDESYEAE